MTQQTFQLFADLSDGDYQALKADIAKRGVLVPVELDEDGNILDGHHRVRACEELGRTSYPRVVRSGMTDAEKRSHVRALNIHRRHLTSEQKRQVIAEELKENPEQSNREVARTLGVSDNTVRAVRSDLESTAQIAQLDRTIGKDGKSRPATKPHIVVHTPRDERRATEALRHLGDSAPSKPLELKRAERIAREQESEKRRSQPVEPTTVSGDVVIHHGDFREALLRVPAGSVDAIITDPPYERAFWDEGGVYGDLGVLANALLRPSGVLVVMIGTRLEMLDAVDAAIGRYMRRRWRAIYLTPGPRWRDQGEKVATGYKPVLIYSHPDAGPDDVRWLNDDIFTSSADDKRYHHWGQSESGMASIVERLTEPGQLVVDPFLGGGTTAVVCRDLGRGFIGCDLDAAAVAAARERVA